MDEVMYKLNNFVSPFKCRKCDKNVTQMSILKGYDGVSVSSFYTTCDDSSHLEQTTERTVLYPIKYSILELFPAFPKHVRQDIQKVLLKLTGFQGRKTKKALAEHIDNLTLKIPKKKKPTQGLLF